MLFRSVAHTVDGVTVLDPLPAATLTLKDPNGKTVGTGSSDGDGFYSINYKYTGKSANFTLKAVSSKGTQTKTVTLKANGFVQVDFQFQ